MARLRLMATCRIGRGAITDLRGVVVSFAGSDAQ